MKKFFARFRTYLPAILVVGLLLIPTLSFATDVVVDTGKGSDTLKGLAEILGVFIEILTFIALLMLKFFGDLLGTEMITGSEAMRAIQPMWMWVRNLTNILFVGVLLFLAFSNLFSSLGFGGDGGNWTIKEKLPKLIISIIAINFSLLGFKIVIDAVNVGTIAILGIADHRLNPDTNGLKKVMTGSRSWMQVSKDQKKDIEDLSTSTQPAALPLEVVGGTDCTNEWNDAHSPADKLKCDREDAKLCSLGAVNGDKYFVCRGFTEQINDLFCKDWATWKSTDNYSEKAKGNDRCIFLMQPEKFGSLFVSSEEPGQNLFAAFGSAFMHLEKLPALGAEIKNIGSIVTNTIFSAVLSLAFIVALIAVFIAMVGRLIVLWIALVFSPLLVGASIMGIEGGKGGDITTKIVTHLIMPLKVAAAFAVGFVMMSAMVEIQINITDSTFIFGPALSQLGTNEYAFLWQIATIVLFWQVAFWALEGSIADKLIQGVKGGAEALAGTALKASTIDRPMFSKMVGDKEKSFSLGSMLQMPNAIRLKHEADKTRMLGDMKESFGLSESGYRKVLSDSSMTTVKEASDTMEKAGSYENFMPHKERYVQLLEKSSVKAVQDLAPLVAAAKGEDELKRIFSTRGFPMEFDESAASTDTTTDTSKKEDTKTPSSTKNSNNDITFAKNQDNGKTIDNRITYDPHGEKQTTTANLETAINTTNAADAVAIGTAIGAQISSGLILTEDEGKELKGKTDKDGVLDKTLQANDGWVPTLDKNGNLRVALYKAQESGAYDLNNSTETEVKKGATLTLQQINNIPEPQRAGVVAAATKAGFNVEKEEKETE